MPEMDMGVVVLRISPKHSFHFGKQVLQDSRAKRPTGLPAFREQEVKANGKSKRNKP